MYTHSLGDTGMTVSVSNVPLAFNSTKYPGICKPSDTRTLAAFKELQSQLNRLAKGKGLSDRISVDGDIGPGTSNLMVKTGMSTSTMACTAIAVAATAFAAQAKQLADQLKAPASVAGPLPVRAPTLVSSVGLEIPAPATGIGAGVFNAFTGMSTPMKVAAVGILAGIGYFAFKKKGR
jgi:hypothetical protein